jgi:hypothetical protein
MSIAYDAVSSGSGTSSFSWTHTPVGTPKGVFVFVQVNASTSTTHVSGVTYGGVAMTQQQVAVDSVGETGTCFGFFLGSSIPTGAQTVAVTVADGSKSEFADAITVTAAADTRLAGTGSGKVEGDIADPSVTITGISGASYGAAGLFSGQNTVPAITAGTGQTMRNQQDFGTTTTSVESSTSEQASGDLTMAFTVAIEDVAMVAIAIEEAISSVKTWNGLARASVKTIQGLAIASVKTVNGLA